MTASIVLHTSTGRSVGHDFELPATYSVTNWESEKQMATQLRKLRREVKRLTEEIRGSAIPTRRPSSGPSFPTDPERRLRLVLNDTDDEKK
jgi:hypothetical protein